MTTTNPTTDPVRRAAELAADQVSRMARQLSTRLGDGRPAPVHAVARLLLDLEKMQSELTDGLARLG